MEANMKTALLKTSLGLIKIKLFPESAPITVENFIGLATGSKEWLDPKIGKKVSGQKLYDGTLFHRVIPEFMIQGGDPLGRGTGGPGYRFACETKPTDRFDRPGILAMANAGPNTNGSQFFITVKPTPWLNGNHTIFGEVTEGMDVVVQISKSPRDGIDRPTTPILLESVTIE
jgi:peptidyl-prolyl cis-trans isomerase A (cyclophilin A)